MGFDLNPNIPIQINCKNPIMDRLAAERKCISKEEIRKLVILDSPEINSYIDENIELLIPLVINGKIAGIVLLGGRIETDAIDPEEKEFLTEIGIYASIAIQNSILFDMATMDMMTGLKVKHYITKFMDECIDVGEHQFVVLMMDIDDFKSINDTYGHQTGDDVIISVANIIKSEIRSHDIASRFGGEEFLVMLRETNLEDAVLVAERILKNIENYKIRTGKEFIGVTISIGAAEFDDDIDKRPEDVIGRADEALYKSKKNGKNQITKI